MTDEAGFQFALAEAIRRTGIERYRYLCLEHPSEEVRVQYRELVRSIAGRPASDYPSLFAQAGNLAGAVGRVISAVVHGEPVKVSEEVYAERLAICLPCEFNGARPDGVRCTKCGCPGKNLVGLGKLQLATERCPIGKWETVHGDDIQQV